MRRCNIAPYLKRAGAPKVLVDYYKEKFGTYDREPVDAEDFAGILRSCNSWLQEEFEPAVMPSLCRSY